MEMFSEDVVGIVSRVVNDREGKGQNTNVTKDFKLRADEKANQRRNKLAEKKSKKLAKFKHNQ